MSVKSSLLPNNQLVELTLYFLYTLVCYFTNVIMIVLYFMLTLYLCILLNISVLCNSTQNYHHHYFYYHKPIYYHLSPFIPHISAVFLVILALFLAHPTFRVIKIRLSLGKCLTAAKIDDVIKLLTHTPMLLTSDFPM